MEVRGGTREGEKRGYRTLLAEQRGAYKEGEIEARGPSGHVRSSMSAHTSDVISSWLTERRYCITSGKKVTDSRSSNALPTLRRAQKSSLEKVSQLIEFMSPMSVMTEAVALAALMVRKQKRKSPVEPNPGDLNSPASIIITHTTANILITNA